MDVFVNIFLTSLLIMFIVISPLPSLPVLIMNYTLNGFVNGLVAFYIGLIGALTCHYYIGLNLKFFYSKISKNTNFAKNIFLSSKYIKKISQKASKTISSLSSLEFFLLRLSSTLPFKLVNIACGLNKRPFFEFILLTIIAQAPSQLIYYSASSQASIIDKYSEFLGIGKYESFLAKVSIGSFIVFLIMIFLRFTIKKLGIKMYKL